MIVYFCLLLLLTVQQRIKVEIIKKYIITSFVFFLHDRLGSTCNHIAAVLFKVEYAWTNGFVIKESPTSLECQWNNYGKKRKIEPKRVCEMRLRKPKYKKKDREATINPPYRQSYHPEILEVDKNNHKLNSLLDALYPSIPNACGFQYADLHTTFNYLPEDDINVENTVEIETSTIVPKSIPEIVSEVDTVSELLEIVCSFSIEQVCALESQTLGQNDNENWKSQRVGRITASVAHSVMTKVNTLKQCNDKTNSKCTSLLESLCSLKSNSKIIPALLYGINMEDEARQAYIKEVKQRKHQNTQVRTSGLTVLPNKAYIGASPDGLVDCACCGKGLLEIKCPISIADSAPNENNLKYLKTNDKGDVNLSKSHPYYSQVQYQMGVTARLWCDFFVYSKHGFYLERIKFDVERWKALESAADYFFENHIIQYLMSNKNKNN